MSSTPSSTARWIGYAWALGLIAAAYAIHHGLESVFGEHDPLLLLALAAAEDRVRIPIDARVDSLNLATAVAIALHRIA